MRIDARGFRLQKISSMLDEFNESKKWLESQGLRVDRTRFQQYRELTNNFFLERKTVQYSEIDVLWAFSELHEICEIYKILKCIDISTVNQLLKKVIKGPLLLSDEKKDGGSIQGRNFTFELYTAARFLRANLNVFYESKADINLDISSFTWHVECKRVVSRNNFDELVERALSQIRKRCQDKVNHVGLIALSLSRLMFEEQTYNTISHRSDYDELSHVLQYTAEYISQEIRSRFKGKEDKCMGVLFHYKFPYFSAKNGYPYIISRFSYVPFSKKNTVEMEVSDIFSNSLRKSINKS